MFVTVLMWIIAIIIGLLFIGFESVVLESYDPGWILMLIFATIVFALYLFGFNGDIGRIFAKVFFSTVIIGALISIFYAYDEPIEWIGIIYGILIGVIGWVILIFFKENVEIETLAKKVEYEGIAYYDNHISLKTNHKSFQRYELILNGKTYIFTDNVINTIDEGMFEVNAIFEKKEINIKFVIDYSGPEIIYPDNQDSYKAGQELKIIDDSPIDEIIVEIDGLNILVDDVFVFDRLGTYQIHAKDILSNTMNQTIIVTQSIGPKIMIDGDTKISNTPLIVFVESRIPMQYMRYQNQTVSGDVIEFYETELEFSEEGVYKIEVMDIHGNFQEDYITIDYTPPSFENKNKFYTESFRYQAYDSISGIKESYILKNNKKINVNHGERFTEVGRYEFYITDYAGNTSTITNFILPPWYIVLIIILYIPTVSFLMGYLIYRGQSHE